MRTRAHHFFHAAVDDFFPLSNTNTLRVECLVPHFYLACKYRCRCTVAAVHCHYKCTLSHWCIEHNTDDSVFCVFPKKRVVYSAKFVVPSSRNAHTILDTPLLVRSAKLSRIGPSQVRKWETIAKRKVVFLFAAAPPFAAHPHSSLSVLPPPPLHPPRMSRQKLISRYDFFSYRTWRFFLFLFFLSLPGKCTNTAGPTAHTSSR